MLRAYRLIPAILAVTLLVGTTPAQASPVNDKRAQAVRVKAQIDDLDNRLEAATEDFNVAADAYGKASARVRRTQAQLARIGARTDVLQSSLDTRANVMYRSGPEGFLDVLLGSATFEDFAATWDFLNQQNASEAKSIAELKQLRAEAETAKVRLVAARAQAKKVYATMTARKDYIESQLGARKRMLSGIESEIAALEAADRAARAAAARRYGYSGGGHRGTGWDWGNPKRAPRGEVVAIALRYLGSPYQWAASGPGRFDCSGFTMFVYAQVGVSLPHSSREQIGCGERVSRANLKPGDLVFFGSPIHHVGLYIGNGQMVHAPHTGDVVSIDSIDRGNYAGAVRP